MAQKYYDIRNMLSTEAQYMILLGQRANGKSYQAKKTVIENYFNTGHKFVYLRRWKEDIKAKSVQAYFEDCDIKRWTNGEFDSIICWNGSIYFGKYNEEKQEIEKKNEIGKYCALNEAERYKSWAFVDYDYIIFEEFITDNIYLADEPRLLQQFVSTVARLSAIHVIMVGNTLTRVCPYFGEWCLDGVLKQKQGTIEMYHFHTEDGVVNIAVEYCANTNYKNKMFFGQTAKQIISGEWDTKDEPKIPRNQDDYEMVYEVKVKYQKFSFVMQLMIEKQNGGAIVFVYPFTGHRDIYRILTDEFSDSRFITSTLDMTRKPELMIKNCWIQNKFCYSDNMTGADFKSVLKSYNFI